MPMSTDVSLPKAWAAVFPDRCVVCGAEGPGGTFAVGTTTASRGTALFGLPWTAKTRIAAPACRDCGRLIWLQRLVAAGLTAALAAVAIMYVWPAVEPHVPRAARRLARWGVVLLSVVPTLAWQMFHPPPFDVTAGDREVDYEFASEAYAREFARLNDAEAV